RRHDHDPRGHGRQDQPGPDLLPDEPRPDRERGPEPRHPGLPRGVHEGAPDGVRHRVQPPREARDGGLTRLAARAYRLQPVQATPAERPGGARAVRGYPSTYAAWVLAGPETRVPAVRP